MADKYRTSLLFYVNGQRRLLHSGSFDPEQRLVDYLRSEGLTGTKLGCAEGACGACTVMVSRYNVDQNKVAHASVNACLCPLYALDGKHVVTVEGIGTQKLPHPVQERIALLHGTQCGFCTPGFSMSLYAKLRSLPNGALPTEAEVEQCLSGNLCRCTGYRPILDAAKTLASDNAWNSSRVYCPLTLAQLQELCITTKNVRLVAGNTMLKRYSASQGDHENAALVYIGDVDELRRIDFSGNTEAPKLVVGSCVTLAQVLEWTQGMLASKTELQPYLSRIRALHDCLVRVAGPQVRNVATIGGHIAGSPPASDIIPLLLALDASIVFRSLEDKSGIAESALPLSEYIARVRSMAVAGDIIVGIAIPLPQKNSAIATYVCSLKQSMRKANDTAVVGCGMRVDVDVQTGCVADARFVFSGISQQGHCYAQDTVQELLGKQWNDPKFVESDLLEACARDLAAQLTPNVDRAKYRVALATSLLYQFWTTSCQQLHLEGKRQDSAQDQLGYQQPQPVISQQTFAPVEEGALIGKTEPHMSALKHATGEAVYTDDIPPFAGEYYLGIVMSKRAHAKILSIDATKSLAMEGVYPKLFTHKDIPGSNVWNIFKDQEILASNKVHFYGQFIAGVIADSRETARMAAEQVVVEYEDLPAIYTIDDAIEQNSFFDVVNQVGDDDVAQAFANSDHVFEGEARCGAQEHFYMEPHAVIVVPKGEDDEIEVHATTQSLMRCQSAVAHSLNIPLNRISCQTRRVGGGFGGKDSLCDQIVSISALAAMHSKRPVRAVLTRVEDMQVTGKRHPYLGKWKLGVNKNGKVTALQMDIYSNGGFSYDCSVFVMMVSLSSAEGCYYFPNAKFTGRICKTNTQSSTAFRAFGACQIEFVCESMMSEVAERLGIPTNTFRQMNMYREGWLNPSKYPIHDWTVPAMFESLHGSAEYEARRKEIEEFNKRSQFKKRGIAILPTKHGITYGISNFNEAAALVHIQLDGSVLVHHMGVELGQGLHTKMAMIAADALSIPLESVYIRGSATDVVANPTPTGASICTDINGGAVFKACEALAARLKPYRKANMPFARSVLAAYEDQVDLSERAFFKLESIPQDFAHKRGFNYFYYTQGVAVSEVELDTLTGSHTIRRVDILMDVGRSINKAVDIGQIEGAFVQGVGWATTEEWMLDTSNGSPFTSTPSSYKIPTAMDIPRDFRVSILEGHEYKHLRTVHSARAIGEPPLFLGVSVFFALREAVKAARAQSTADSGGKDVIHMDLPATCESLRMMCGDNITRIADKVEAQGLLPESTIQRI
ncbi:hypothetical protein GGI12_001932 [Dipsacomyces acuminosporus]|nr:hypothetical protein GGI12_001932 [Dipsacomyces acuminosporus]